MKSKSTSKRDSSKRKIFLDCGAWKGNSTIHFIENWDYAHLYKIYAFECNPDMLEKMQKNINNKGYQDKVKFIQKALWDLDGVRTLKVGAGPYSESSSLLQHKRVLRHRRADDMRVGCINFSKWLKDNIREDDYVICKMNIEGAEYRVLNKMIGDGTIDLIDELHMSWHWKKVKYSEEKHNHLVAQILKRKTSLITWSLEHGQP